MSSIRLGGCPACGRATCMALSCIRKPYEGLPDALKLGLPPGTNLTPGCTPMNYLTEADVRRIVREELAKEKPNE